MEFFTMGVYGFTSEDFFGNLTSNNIDTFIDIRRRRAVRGSKFSFVNSKSLQHKLAEMGINYMHILELAPTKEIRQLQKEEDKRLGVTKRERNKLGNTFISEYKTQILDNYKLINLIEKLDKIDSRKAILFCVEKEPKACHRSLVAEKLEKDFAFKTKEL